MTWGGCWWRQILPTPPTSPCATTCRSMPGSQSRHLTRWVSSLLLVLQSLNLPVACHEDTTEMVIMLFMHDSSITVNVRNPWQLCPATSAGAINYRCP